ncbi:hypothetical protein DNTS_009915, partial [Danionella cerebrum]
MNYNLRYRVNIMAAVVNYSPPWWVNLFHRLPHFNLQFQQTSSDFRPEDSEYQKLSVPVPECTDEEPALSRVLEDEVGLVVSEVTGKPQGLCSGNAEIIKSIMARKEAQLAGIGVVAGGSSIGVFGPGPPLPPLLLLLAVLLSQEEPRLSQCRLLLHRLVCDHRHARLQ